ncbi:MAG TPA: hypothetical protein VHJ38_18620, partial [Nitrososphaeraceae archaeon]|nr:hypothetical protein [Nitrososphaeraceae archaeon]
MYKSLYFTLFLIGSLLMSTFTLNINLIPNAMAQLKGDRGNGNVIIGPQGPTGPQGPQGEPGPQGPHGLQGFNGTQGILGNISDICPTDTTLELQFVPEVINNGYIVTCSLNNLFIYVTWV